jgi:hypothetical protein
MFYTQNGSNLLEGDIHIHIEDEDEVKIAKKLQGNTCMG